MKILSRLFLITFLSITIFLSSCSEYSQVQKSDDYYLKFAKAKEYYEAKQYYRSLTLLEDLITYFKGTNVMQDVLYYYAYCHYQTGEYLVGAYHFKSFATTYPSDPRAEECLFMNAKCYYEVSPSYMLEQSYTEQSIEAIQLFVNNYPSSKYVDEANKMMDDMRAKLNTKAFYSAELYYRMGKYKAASKALEDMLHDYPDNPEAEEAYFLILKSDYEYAFNSIPNKQEERYQDAIKSYDLFLKKFQASKRIPEAKNIYALTLKNLDKIKNND